MTAGPMGAEGQASVLADLRRQATTWAAGPRAPGLSDEQVWFSAVNALVGGPQRPEVPGELVPWQVSERQLALLVRAFLELLRLSRRAREADPPVAAGDEWTAQAALPALTAQDLEAVGLLVERDLATKQTEDFLRLHGPTVGLMHRAVSFFLVNCAGGLRDAARGGAGA